MKNKLIFRIFGALSCALMIVSVFIPFIKVGDYSQSLWQSHETLDTLYLPIMIIIFGALGVILFATNLKTELTYASVGAVIFFLVIQTVQIIQQDAFDALSIGYYCLVIGVVLAALMTFLCNLKSKKVNVVQDQTVSNNNQNIVNSIPVSMNNVPSIENGINQQNNLQQPISEIVPENVNNQPENLIFYDSQVNNAQVLQQPLNDLNTMPNMDIPLNQSPANNPVVSELNQVNLEPVQPVNEQLVDAQQATPVANNPVVSELNQVNLESVQPVNEQLVDAQQATPVANNPVVSEFSNSLNNVNQESGLPNLNPVNDMSMNNQVSNTSNSGSNLDIFGQ